MSEFSTEWLREIIAERFVDGREGFDRWLAEYTLEKPAEAWEQGKDAREQVPYWRFEGDDPRLDNPYRKEENNE